ncbi:MAG TPA: protein kinase [Gemmatimonadales bacterium]|nr:protein kinase [Gemmatimonadales bacterium]
MADPFEQLRPALADRYALERELGRGGMATVYLARDLRHGRPVAIKVLRPEIAAVLGPERFLREIAVAARLTHPHILPLHDSGQAGGSLYYVMPYIEGESLRDRLDREGQLPLEEAVRITREVASALSYAHSHDVVHRDIKPENILLSGGEAVVADFGIARAISAAARGQLTETGIAIGTPGYMSPEQGAASARVDERSDIYSLGCVLYEMLVGEPPYTGPSAQVVIAKRFIDPVPSVRRLRETIPPAVDAAITRALAKSPADRFRTPAEFARALDRPVGARRSRAGSYAAIAAGLVALAALAYGLWAKRLPRHDAATRVAHKILVVLPLENLGAPEDEYFADGLSEAITTRLGTVPSLGVIARQSAMGYKKTTKSPQAIGKELGVEYILAGTVRWEKSASRPNRVRVSTALMRAADANQLWAKQYDTVLAGIFDVESNLAERVAGALDIALADPERQALSVRPTHDVEAHDLYLKGRYLSNKETEPELRGSIDLFRQALARDSNYALAWAGIADAWILLADAFVAPREAYPKAMEGALKALSIDSTLGEGLAARGAVELLYDWDFKAARHDLGRAIAANPSASTVYVYEGLLLGVLGQLDSALAAFQHAQALDPLSPTVRQMLGLWLLYARRYDQAIREYRSILDLDPHDASAHMILGFALFGVGRDSEALAEFRLGGRIPPGVLGKLGRLREAHSAIQQLIAKRTRGYSDAVVIAAPYAFLGERDRALAWLDTAYADRSATLLGLPYMQPFDAMHDDSHFRALLRKIGLPDSSPQ